MLTEPDPSEDTRAPDAAFLTLFFPALYPRIFFLNSISFIFAFIFQSQLTFWGWGGGWFSREEHSARAQGTESEFPTPT